MCSKLGPEDGAIERGLVGRLRSLGECPQGIVGPQCLLLHLDFPDLQEERFCSYAPHRDMLPRYTHEAMGPTGYGSEPLKL
jgi:hypothetical protein